MFNEQKSYYHTDDIYNKISKNLKLFKFWNDPKTEQYGISGIFEFIVWNKARVLYYINNWVYTTNHKRIAVNYFWFVILAGIVGMVLATIIRLELAYPGVGVFAGDSLQYLSMVSAHGVIMVFFMIMPLLFGAFGNFLLPTQLGVHDVAFPRLNSAAFWFLPAGLIMLAQLVCVDRRYQRMNCFNIREVESLLKRRFFTDLVNPHEFTNLLNETMIGLKYKLNDINYINPNAFLFYNYGYSNNKYRIFQSKNILTENNVTFMSSKFRLLNEIENAPISYPRLQKFYNVKKSFTINDLQSNPFLINSFFKGPNLIEYFFTSIFMILNFIDVSVVHFIKTWASFFFNAIKTILKFIGNTIHTIYYTPYYYTKVFIKNTIWFLKTIDTQIFKDWELSRLSYELDWQYTRFLNYVDDQLAILLPKLKKFAESWVNYFQFAYNNYFVISYKPSVNLNDILITTAKFYHYGNLEKVGYFPFSIVIPYQFYKIEDNVFRNKLYKSELSQYFEMKNILWLHRTNYYKKNKDLNLFLLKQQLVNYKYEIELSNKDFFGWQKRLNFESVGVYFIMLGYLLSYFPSEIIKFIRNIYNMEQMSLQISHLFFFTLNWLFPAFLTIDLSILLDRRIYKFLNSLWMHKIEKETDTPFVKAYKRVNPPMGLDFVKLADYMELFFWYFKQFIYLLPFAFFGLSYPLSHLWNKIWSVLGNFVSIFYNIDIVGFLTKDVVYFLKFIYIKFKEIKSYFFSFFKRKNKNTYKSDYFTNKNNNDILYNDSLEKSSTTRYQRFNDVVFKYDYKSGDYFPTLYKEVYTYLFTTANNVTSGLKTSPWLYSTILDEAFVTQPFKKFSVDEKVNKTQLDERWTSLLSFQATFNINLFENLYNNTRWTSFVILNQKFNNIFLTSSMQQRIYNNWRQLKFTREAWRCKLLSSHHQKTLFKRYVNEDGVFWSIERNAKDLLPGWAMITPFSSRTRFTAIGKTDIALMGVLLVLNSSIISGANFLVTYRYLSTLNNRKMRDARSFFTEGVMVTSWMMILANPMLVIGIIMLLSDRHWQTSFFDYSGGGDTVLFQHMFWFFGHPEVYIIMIPVFGFTNTILSYYLRKRVSARASLMYSMYTIAFLGFFVWGHHMYMVGLAHTTRMLFSTLTVMISVPAATKLMHWCVTMANSSYTVELPLIFILTFIFFFVSGGISGMYVAHTGMDILFHDTFYVIGHFHVMLAGAAMFGSFGAFYFYFPAIFGVKYSRIYAYLHYVYYLIGQLMTVVPMFWLGYAGMPRRVLDYPASLGGWHSLISAGHMLSVAGLISFFLMIFDSIRQNRAVMRTTFGINRFNTRLNFYLYQIAKFDINLKQGWFMFKPYAVVKTKLNNKNYKNFEPLETTLMSYIFSKKKKF